VVVVVVVVVVAAAAALLVPLLRGRHSLRTATEGSLTDRSNRLVDYCYSFIVFCLSLLVLYVWYQMLSEASE
jgi:hypothetical protein